MARIFFSLKRNPLEWEKRKPCIWNQVLFMQLNKNPASLAQCPGIVIKQGSTWPLRPEENLQNMRRCLWYGRQIPRLGAMFGRIRKCHLHLLWCGRVSCWGESISPVPPSFSFNCTLQLLLSLTHKQSYHLYRRGSQEHVAVKSTEPDCLGLTSGFQLCEHI